MKVKDASGAVFCGETCGDLVQAMKLDSYTVAADVDSYMTVVADRIFHMDATDIQYKDATGFIQELVRVGVLAWLTEKEESDVG
jgi:hypothetical protein